MLNVFLDLEETIIDDWFSCNFLNHKIKKIKSLINQTSLEFNGEEATNENINLILFSAAVVNNEDLLEFKKNIKPIIEEKLGIFFKEFVMFSKENIFKIAKINGIKPLKDDTIHDLFPINIKENIFNLIAKEDEINLLFDDTVENKISFEGLPFGNSLPKGIAKTVKILVNMK